ncbi:zinc ribbon domain-containing protein [Streptococcus mutans]|uniref:zinc ribbon domain-containing protein n=1 Tax=Streptococcus mutans TaxID=1309 RepID=UPI0002B515FE|nr:hypothetical protein [Streptococcus mutans]EMB72316.1 hypothetical protein SMU36_05235 [Streptococcus mutans 4VF1]EMC34064.1 hypothetical protein SMU89_02432 [Streptococcus mutans NLML1]MCB5098201.1 hypothetical protein [Streptococcus mutans]MCY7122818.1 hypothetical protein [Streptococcus mutans]NLR05541.1 hypothetical protein [Streptococcus mutans]
MDRLKEKWQKYFKKAQETVATLVGKLKQQLQDLLKRKPIRTTLIIIGSFFVLFGLWGSIHYSKAATLDRYLKARSASGHTFENIKEYMVWDDTNELITNDEAQYTKFSRLKTSLKKRSLRQKLLSAKASDKLYLKSIGHKFFFFPDYRLAMKPLKLTLKTNVSGLDVLLNGKKIATSDSDNYHVTVTHLPIDNYTFTLDGIHNGKEVEFNKNYDGKHQTVNMNLAFKNFTVKSNLSDGNLYFDKKKISSLSNGQYNVDNYPIMGSKSVYVKKNFSDGTIKSNKQSLKDIADGSTVQLDVPNQLNQDTAQQLLNTAFEKFSVHASNQQDPTDLNTVFENGSNNDVYKALKESIKQKMMVDSRKPSSFTITSVSLNDLHQTGMKTYTLSYALTYDYYYDEATDQEKKTSGHLLQNITGQVQVKKTETGYTIRKSISGPTVVSEDNQVKSPMPLPEELIGTWETKQDDKTVTMIFSEDGTVTKKTDYKDDKKEDTTKTAKVEKTEKTSGGTYRYYYQSGDRAALTVLDDIGANDQYTYGVKINGSSITTVYWESGDTSGSPKTGISLTKK